MSAVKPYWHGGLVFLAGVAGEFSCRTTELLAGCITDLGLAPDITSHSARVLSPTLDSLYAYLDQILVLGGLNSLCSGKEAHDRRHRPKNVTDLGTISSHKYVPDVSFVSYYHNLARVFFSSAYPTTARSVPRAETTIPAPPKPEPIKLTTLPLPPVAPSNKTGACTKEVNPRGTGCMTVSSNLDLQAGGFLPDGKHVLVFVTFTGAPSSPDPANVYNRSQIIAVKTDGNKFPSGDPWKCLTCGLPEDNTAGKTATFDYPQAFSDGKRILFGTNILDCGKYQLVDDKCTPKQTHIYPIRWNTSPEGTGNGGAIRELRLHPDGVHLGFSSFASSNGKIGQFAYFAKLRFNPKPTAGTPLVPRYDLTKVTVLFNPRDEQPIEIDGNSIVVNRDAIAVGEFRGFSGRGTEATYVGYPIESSNIDVFAVHLQTGKVRRLTSHPEYCDPLAISPDDEWIAIDDTRGTDRQMWLSGMRNIPPVTDLISTSPWRSRRLFRSKINGEGEGVAGSGDYNDPEWNAMADPRWSPDGTQIVYWEAQTVTPACGGANPLPCYPSKEPGGRRTRVILANLSSRKSYNLPSVKPVLDEVPWGVPYAPGDATPNRPQPSPGNYTLRGVSHGYADVEIIGGTNGSIGEIGCAPLFDSNTTNRSRVSSAAIPDRELSEELVDLYFVHVNASLPSLFHRPTLKSSVQDGRISKALLLAIISLSARFSSHPGFADIEPCERGRPYAKEAERLLNLREKSLTTIQTCILLGTAFQIEGDPDTESVYYAIASRIALLLDLPNANASSLLEQELNRRSITAKLSLVADLQTDNFGEQFGGRLLQ
ncbi:hypothetical protein FSARC_11138 [Fusarium sarcochroum]|uniref:Uncharacterized protein n=1 Tax=Fusarium sarcochroum TaxID=1208366 RepID=A0A8H4X1V0_9HYPO|nr:hypothetical protein FSARC_11138 [Fusarium sarcochroum]